MTIDLPPSGLAKGLRQIVLVFFSFPLESKVN
jgi:hypothetical protein